MALVGTDLTDAHGSPFKTVNLMATPSQPPGNAKKGVQSIVEHMESTLPLDSNPSTSNFTPPPVVNAQAAMNTQPDKLSRILSLVEQNKTGYEPSSNKDMFLYVLTGVLFLFTFDTFVSLGKSMR